MTQGTAKQLIVASVVVAGALAAFQPLSKGDAPSIRLGVGLLFMATFLLLLSDVQPEIAGSLALLVLISSLVGLGPEPLAKISKAVKG